MSCPLVNEKVWLDKAVYDDAERTYYEQLAKSKNVLFANEQVRDLEKEVSHLNDIVYALQATVKALGSRLAGLENTCAVHCGGKPGTVPVDCKKITSTQKVKEQNDSDDDDVDLFGSDSEDENDEAAKVREERLAAYAAKKSKKPALIAKSNVILDVKPWDDETDMKVMEAEIRKITMDGLLLGAAKLVPLAYGIHKLQISCVIEDDKVSVDLLQEKIEAIEDFVQSVDIAAFNKI